MAGPDNPVACPATALSDRDRWWIFLQFRAETPPELLFDRAHAPDHFADRMRFEEWRARWLAYLAGLVEGPTSRAQYAELRHRLFAGRRPDIDEIDRFHS